jgi:redox-sensitive bicupin YhaK (pirin superfamily)
MSILTPRDVPLGGLRAMTVRRTLPNRQRSTIGAWCFVDHYGPDEVELTGGMNLGAHPHTGLQTVTWLFQGEVEHRDSVGSVQLIEPGQVNLMTAGAGIAHAEHSTGRVPVMNGVQLWVALADKDRHIPPFFEHHIAPRTTIGDAQLIVFIGSLTGDTGTVTAGTTTFTPLLGAEIQAPAGSTFTIPVNPAFEHGVLVDAGSVAVAGEIATKDQLAYVEPGHSTLTLTIGDEPARLLLLGGTPFEEELVMWWNFIGRSHDEIVAMREQWQNDVVHEGNPEGIFGHVERSGSTIPAPEMPHVQLRPRKLPRP